MKKHIQSTISKAWLILPAFILGLAAFNPITIRDANASCSSEAGPGVNWQDCRKRNLVMTDFDFSGSNFTKADMSSSDLRGAKLDQSNFSKANLVRASLGNASAREANFSGTIAYRTKFNGGDFSGSNFTKAEIGRADFSKSILENVSMEKGEFSRVVFSDAQIGNVSFDYSNLARSDFRGANIIGPLSMMGTFLFRTRLEGVDLSAVKGLQAWQLDMACGDDATVLPDGLNKPSSWPCQGEDE